ncbi:MAG TPA: hypothetical protein VF540_09195, partial [Segetibacter sp.]
MTFNNNRLAIVFCFFSLSCVSTRLNTKAEDALPATALKPFGRFIITNGRDLELISSAVHFGFSFEGNECRIHASIPDAAGHNYLQYELDGVYGKRIRLAGNSTEPIILTAPNGGPHKVWIYKATEAHTGPIFIQKITG